ncbi:tetratricopeptide repeat protein [Streptomyces sp. NPDC090022]|uniref:tetratricopeptide repeat protein n=1 Tax=Streptomyces sp. NPDC090022 TaxID=3365920 RepID=UPI0038102C77
MRESHRSEAEQMLVRAVEEEARRPGAGIDKAALLARGREALDALAASAAEEYEAYVRALDEAAAGERSLGESFRRANTSTALLVTGVAAAAAFGADLALGVASGTALAAGAVVGVAGAAATVAKVTAAHVPAAHRRAGALGQPGGPQQLRLQWLSALEVRGVRPFLEQQRLVAAARTARPPASAGAAAGPRLRGSDRSAQARRRHALEQSFGQLPEPAGPFVGRREELTRIAQWVRAARASTRTRPVVVVLHGEPGAGRTALAVRAAHQVRDQFRGACVVDLRGGSPGGLSPLPTREALLHLLNRLGAPREQLLFRERSSQEQQVRHLGELYLQHLHGLPVTVVLDDASDADQVRALVPEHSDSLVLVTAREPLELPADLAAWVHHLPVERLGPADAAELVRAAAVAGEQGAQGEGDGDWVGGLVADGGGLPLALRILAPLGAGAGDDGVRAPEGALEQALGRAYARLPEERRLLLRRLPLAGRASLGVAAAAALADVPQAAARRGLDELCRAGLIDRVRGERYRMHDAVRSYAAERLAADEDRAGAAAAHERLIRTYAQLADAVIRMVDGKTSTRAHQFGGHGFSSLDAALRWLEEESSFITAALRHTEGVDRRVVLDLLGALCDFCLLRGDLYRLGEIDELARAVERASAESGAGAGAGAGDGDGAGAGAGAGEEGVLVRSVRWRTGIAARQLGDLDTAHTTLTSVVDQYFEAHHEAGAARALVSLGITLHHQGQLTEAAGRIREAIALQEPPELAGDRAWALHALGAVERDLSRLSEAAGLLERSLVLHRENESVHGEAWAHFQLGQVFLRSGDVARAEAELGLALELYGRTRDGRGQAWALTQLGRARVVAGDAAGGLERLREALARHREAEDARGEAWTLYHLGQALEESGDRDPAVRELERARTMFSRMRDGYGLACARHHSGRVTRDQRAALTGNLRNSGFARQLLVDARADFRRIGLAHGEGWTCLELAVIDAGNGRVPAAVALCEEAGRLFASYDDRRGGDWARFLRCTLLPYAGAAGSGAAGSAAAGSAAAGSAAAGAGSAGSDAAAAELAALRTDPHPSRDRRLSECLDAFGVLLSRGTAPGEDWPGWRLSLIPDRHSREVLGVPRPT